MQGRHDLTDAEWAIISPLPPDKPRGDQREFSHPAHRHAVARPSATLRAACDSLQPLQLPGQARGVGATVRGAGDGLAGISSSPRRLGGARPPARRGRKKGGSGPRHRTLARRAEHGSCPHIPTQRDRREQRSASHHLYRQRNLVERFFNKLKHFRGIATRHHKLARNFLAAIAVACIRLNEYTT